MSTITYVCCGRRLTPVTIHRAGVSVAFTFCGQCDGIRWYRDDVPLDPADVASVTGRLTDRPYAPAADDRR